MKMFKNIRLLASGLVIVALALYGVNRGRSVAQAAGEAPVLVTNTGAAQAVPVSYPTTPTVNIGSVPSITGTVGITGTPTVNLGSATSPVLVRDVDNPARHAFQTSGNLTLADGTGQGTIALTTVPSGKLLVIEHVAMWAALPGVEDLDPSNTHITTEVNGRTPPIFLNATRINLTGGVTGTTFYVVSQSLRLYADPGTTVTLFVARLETSGGAQFTGSISGYLVDCGSGLGCSLP